MSNSATRPQSRQRLDLFRRQQFWRRPRRRAGHASDRQTGRAWSPTPCAIAAAKGDIVLDPFLGSGTTVMAAEKIGRVCFGLELEPAYVDVAVRRWQAYAKTDAMLEGDGRTFDEVAAARLASAAAGQ